MWGYKDELEDLNKTIDTIKNVLLDAEAKHDDLSHAQRGYIAELKAAVYDADDLFDEFRTLAELDEIDPNYKSGKFSAKVRNFFSSTKKKSSQARRMSRRVKEIKAQLDGIAGDYAKYGLGIGEKPIVRRRKETCAHVDVKNVIGRDNEKEAIIDMLMGPNSDDEGFCFLTIVGVGGLGKTTLAQLVFNDEKIEKEFSSFRFWVCVSDQDGEEFDVRTILSKILEGVTKKVPDNSSSMQLVQNQFREQFIGKKYFLVLDDVWNESRKNWVDLKEFLMMGACGSKILVTSRSEKTSSIIGSKHVIKLEGLSEKDSQGLFEMSAFDEGKKHPELVKIGKNISRKCCGIPLAIKVVGSLLYGEDTNKWESIEKCIEKSGMADIDKGDNNDTIVPILKISYYNLLPSLKSCFCYCALFPKDFRMSKAMLIDLWIAQGYVVPFDGGQSVEDAAEQHFLILMQRCFFQDIEKDKYGNVEFVKIHDLMHDVACTVGKDEICVVTSKGRKLEENTRHVYIVDNCAKASFCSSKIHSCICPYSVQSLLDEQIGKMTALRVLILSGSFIKSLPRSIDRLLLLRYLNLCYNSNLEVLPDAITRLYNLQTLVLRHCRNLREIPKDFSNLINLRHLDFSGCKELRGMPLGMSKLTNLRVLPYFVTSNDISDDELKVLHQILTKLKGQLFVVSTRYRLLSMYPLESVTINYRCEGERVNLGGGLEKLELPSYLKELQLSDYSGTTIPVLSKLPNLKSLKLESLKNVVYMENNGMRSSSSNVAKAVDGFFPSLEFLEIGNLLELKGWWKGDFPGMRLIFPRLSHLDIQSCPNFTSFAPCSNPEYLPEIELPNLCALRIRACPNLASVLIFPPTLEKLALINTSERLLIPSDEFVKLREMEIEKMDHLKLLPPTNCLTSLRIMGDIEVEDALEHVQCCAASSLRTLDFLDCKNLKRLVRLNHFTALEELKFLYNFELSICEEDEEPWKFLPQSLRTLRFCFLPKMKSLPKGMQQLTSLQFLALESLEKMEGGLPEGMSSLSSLQSLNITHCPGINSLPEAMKDLTSLKELWISGCPDLEERCKKPNGEDFSKIQHIPLIMLGWNRIQ